jgi:hypothetical protein
MFCIPYIWKELPTAPELVQVWLFLERNGTQAIQIADEQEGYAMAAENGIPLAGPGRLVEPDLLLLPVDANSDELKLFYTWSEVRPHEVPMRELWRPFVWSLNSAWGSNEELRSIELGRASGLTHTVYSVLGCLSRDA